MLKGTILVAVAFIHLVLVTGVLGVVQLEGLYALPVWFIMDADDLLFTTMCTSLKYKIMQRDPRISICVDEEAYPYGFAVLHGVARVQPLSVEELLPWTTKIAARYVPDPLADQFGKRNAVPEERLIRVTPERVFAFSGVAD